MPTIRIDDDVYAWLQGQARPFEDTPNTVLRRIANLEEAIHASTTIVMQGRHADMQNPRFDETDRAKVISEVEKHFGVKLKRVGRYRKFLEDVSTGKSYWIFGGYEDWHGVSADMLEEERKRSSDGVLVVAKRYKSSIDIFSGPLKTLISKSEELSHTRTGDYQFNVSVRGNSMEIKEAAGLTLRKIDSSHKTSDA